MNKIKKNIWAQLFIIYTRYLIGSAFVFASVIKIQGKRFTAESGVSNPIDTSWHFFETMYQSGVYWKFIGVAQLLAGFLLMTQRYAKLGALLNLPIIANVFVITISYYFAYTPVITGLMLLANLMLILWDWDQLKVIINLPPQLNNFKGMDREIFWQMKGLILFGLISSVRFFITKDNFIVFMIVLFIIGMLGFVFGIREVLKIRKRIKTII